MQRLRTTSGRIAVVAAAALALAGCGHDGPKTYTVRGKFVLADGDVKQLADSYIECVPESDGNVRADGTIGPDGSFELQILHKGQVVTGAPEGTYQARIILSDEYETAGPKRRPPPIHPRFLNPKTSGLTLKVPTDGAVTLNVSRR